MIYGVIALAVFFVADPYLWPDPVNRLKDSILFHSAYAQSGLVESAGLPFYQPLAYLMQSVPWHPGVFKVKLELVVFLLAMAGIKPIAKTKPFILYWFFISLGFLLIWPTKWPQYVLILLAPLAWLAAEVFRSASGSRWSPGCDVPGPAAVSRASTCRCRRPPCANRPTPSPGCCPG